MNDITMIVIMLNGAMIGRNDMGDRTQFIASSPFQLSFFFHSSFLFFSISTWIQGSRIMYRKCEREGYNNQVKQIPITTTVIQRIYAFLQYIDCITYRPLYPTKVTRGVYIYTTICVIAQATPIEQTYPSIVVLVTE